MKRVEIKYCWGIESNDHFFTLTKLHQKYQLGHVSAQIFTSECEYIKCFTELAAYCNFVVQRSTVSNQQLDWSNSKTDIRKKRDENENIKAIKTLFNTKKDFYVWSLAAVIWCLRLYLKAAFHARLPYLSLTCCNVPRDLPRGSICAPSLPLSVRSLPQTPRPAPQWSRRKYRRPTSQEQT